METNNSNTGSAGSNTVSTGGLAVNALAGAIRAAVSGSAPVAGVGETGRIAITFMSNDTDALFVVATARIIAGMTGNKAFPTPAPTLDEVIAARNAYTAAVTAGLDSRLGRSLRRKTRAELVVLLRQLAHYVQDSSGGDRTVLMSSGFPLQRQRTPAGVLPAPTLVRLVKGKVSGSAIARCRKIDRARAYQWRIAPAATPTAWLPVVTTFAAHAVFEGLTSTTVYVVQVCAAGTAGVGDWSEPATGMVL